MAPDVKAIAAKVHLRKYQQLWLTIKHSKTKSARISCHCNDMERIIRGVKKEKQKDFILETGWFLKIERRSVNELPNKTVVAFSLHRTIRLQDL